MDAVAQTPPKCKLQSVAALHWMSGCESQHIVTLAENKTAIRLLRMNLRTSEAPGSKHAAIGDADVEGGRLRWWAMKRQPDSSNDG